MLYGSCICINKKEQPPRIAGYIAIGNFSFLSLLPDHLEYDTILLPYLLTYENKIVLVYTHTENTCQHVTTNQTEDPPGWAFCFWHCPLTLQQLRKEGRDKANTELYFPLLYSCSFQQTATTRIHAVGGFICKMNPLWALAECSEFIVKCHIDWFLPIQARSCIDSPQTGGWVSGF